jgi:tetratricopeptide (TPR) repeat protein
MFFIDTQLSLVPLLFGVVGVALYFIVKTIRDNVIDIKRSSILVSLQQVMMVFSSFAIFFTFGDLFITQLSQMVSYTGLVIMSIFAVMSLFYFIKSTQRYTKLTMATIVYLLLSSLIVFVICFEAYHNNHKPETKYTIHEGGSVEYDELAHYFKSEEVERLYSYGCFLRESANYEGAIKAYKEALEIEPDNVAILMNLSGCYAVNDLEPAIALLDKAIAIDDSFAPLYLNRATFYQLKDIPEDDKALADFQKAIDLATKQQKFDWVADCYAYSAWSYYRLKDQENYCQSLLMAEKLGFDFSIPERDDLRRMLIECY